MSLASRLVGLARCSWRLVFPSLASSERAIEHLLAMSSTLGRRTISRTIIALGRSDQDWSADYKLFSRTPWDARELFTPVLAEGTALSGDGPIAIAVDDTKLCKSGRHVPQAGWHRDPLSPPFHMNLQWGLRYLQASLLIRADANRACRSLPVRFEPAPWVKKPGKKASPEDRAAYAKAKKEQNLSITGRNTLEELRLRLDRLGHQERLIVAAVDGSFCNRPLFGEPLNRIRLLARARKDARLCLPAASGSRCRYDPQRFTPEQVRQDEAIPWNEAEVFYAGRRRPIRYKERFPVLWRRGAKTRPLRLLVIAPQPYTAPSGRCYRDPAYLLTDDLESEASLLIQIYFDRWQIEVNHREEKSFMGVGDAQLWSELAASRHPTFQVACYSLILLATLLEFGPARGDAFPPLPKWRKPSDRPSILDLLTRLRLDLCNETLVSLPIPPRTAPIFVLSAFT
jgi:hypothetical protein